MTSYYPPLTSCCSILVEREAKLIAIVQVILSFYAVGTVNIFLKIIRGILHLVTISQWSSVEFNNEREMGKYPIQLVIICLSVVICHAYLHLYLYRGIQKRNYRKVNTYFKIMMLAFVFSLLQSGMKAEGTREYMNILLSLYTLRIVYIYKTHIRY